MKLFHHPEHADIFQFQYRTVLTLCAKPMSKEFPEDIVWWGSRACRHKALFVSSLSVSFLNSRVCEDGADGEVKRKT